MHAAPDRPRRQRGFTLVELMIVVVVMGILATVATSSYRRYVLRANRTEARIVLLSIQAGQEKYFLQNNAYAQNIATLIATPANGGLGLNLTTGGLTPTGNYTISFAAAAPTTYTVQAVATGAQAKDTSCATYTVNESGVRTPADSTGCWAR